MRVYPSPGLLVRDPVKRDFLPQEGREVDDGDFYWLRRLGCQDATTTKPDAFPASSAPVIAETKALKSTPSDGSDNQ